MGSRLIEFPVDVLGRVGRNVLVLDQTGFRQNDRGGADGGHQLARGMHLLDQVDDFRRVAEHPGACAAGQDQGVQLVRMELVQHGVRGDGHVMGADHLVRLHAGQLHVKVQAAQDVQRSHEFDFFKSGGGEDGGFFHG